eukprot:101532_1
MVEKELPVFCRLWVKYEQQTSLQINDNTWKFIFQHVPAEIIFDTDLGKFNSTHWLRNTFNQCNIFLQDAHLSNIFKQYGNLCITVPDNYILSNHFCQSQLTPTLTSNMISNSLTLKWPHYVPFENRTRIAGKTRQLDWQITYSYTYIKFSPQKTISKPQNLFFGSNPMNCMCHNELINIMAPVFLVNIGKILDIPQDIQYLILCYFNGKEKQHESEESDSDSTYLTDTTSTESDTDSDSSSSDDSYDIDKYYQQIKWYRRVYNCQKLLLWDINHITEYNETEFEEDHSIKDTTFDVSLGEVYPLHMTPLPVKYIDKETNSETVSQINLSHILLVNGYINEYIKYNNFKSFISQFIKDLILFFYAKPLVIELEYSNESKTIRKYILYCPILEDWNSIIQKVLTIYNLNPNIEIILQDTQNNFIYTASNWNEWYCDENMSLKVICDAYDPRIDMFYFFGRTEQIINGNETANQTVNMQIIKEFVNLFQNTEIEYNENIIIERMNYPNIYKWDALFIGPFGTPYVGGQYRINIHFSGDYLIKPPIIVFLTKIYNASLVYNGKTKRGILELPEHFNQIWNVNISLIEWLNVVYDFVFYYCGDNYFEPYDTDIAKQFVYAFDSFVEECYQWNVGFANGYNLNKDTVQFCDIKTSYSLTMSCVKYCNQMDIKQYKCLRDMLWNILFDKYNMTYEAFLVFISYYGDEFYFCGLSEIIREPHVSVKDKGKWSRNIIGW